MAIEARPPRHVALAGLLALAFSMVAPGARAQSLPADFAVAVANDRVPEVKRLLAAGANPDTVDGNGDPMIVIAARAGNAATVDVLLAARANVNARTGFGDTALMVAALGGRGELVRKLRAAGADVNQQGWTALIYAATGGHDEIVRFLLAEGADINAAAPKDRKSVV